MGASKPWAQLVAGDSQLSSYDYKLWALTWHTMLKFQTPVMFKQLPRNVPQGTDEYLSFFVPKAASNVRQVVEFLSHELKEFERTDGEPGWNTHVSVLTIDNVIGYVERDDMEQIARQMAEKFIQLINNKNDK